VRCGGEHTVLNPPNTPATSALIGRAAGRHLDPAAVAVVEGRRHTAAKLLEIASFDRHLFHRRRPVGRLADGRPARRPSSPPVTLELGGKSTRVVLTMPILP